MMTDETLRAVMCEQLRTAMREEWAFWQRVMYRDGAGLPQLPEDRQKLDALAEWSEP